MIEQVLQAQQFLRARLVKHEHHHPGDHDHHDDDHDEPVFREIPDHENVFHRP